MAPSKKKKKPQSNPARGFATTSSVSKSQIQKEEEPVTDQQVDVIEEAGEATRPSSQNPLQGGQVSTQKELFELTPEELEKQLEESDLQSVIDQYGEAVHRNVTRQVSRLETERRLLRSSAEVLRIGLWLSPKMADEIIDRAHVENVTVYERSGDLSVSNQDYLVTNDNLVKAWTLHELLPRIGFSESQTWAALEELFQQQCPHSSTNSKVSKDSIWGLERCLDWKARNSDVYCGYLDADKTSVKLCASKSTNQILEPEQSQARSFDIGPAMSTSHRVFDMSDTQARSSTSSSSSESDSDWESDLEPDQMQEKYLLLRTRRFHLESRVSESEKSKTKIPSGQILRTGRFSRRLTAVDKKLSKLRSDILFDKDFAEKRWELLQNTLQRDAAKNRQQRATMSRPALQEPLEASPSLVKENQQQDDYEGILTGFFSELSPTDAESIDKAGGQKAGSVQQDIELKDFGKWNGMSPRRILEDACKARDSSVRVSFELLSESSFSHRHIVRVSWSRPQEIPSIMEVAGVPAEADDRICQARMERTACATKAQSEAFVSTIMLFHIFSLSSKEEKCYLRLPLVWKQFWEELCAMRKEESDANTRNMLRKLRSLVARNDSKISPPGLLSVNLNINSNGVPIEASKPQNHFSPNPPPEADPNTIRLSWNSKTSSSSYRSMLAFRCNLPIWTYRQQLLDAVKKHQIVIVCGETGCGKSTQVPAFILEEELSHGLSCKIICAEPRRISAISLAQRVSQELGEQRRDLGTIRSLVGYAIRLESQVTPNTRLVYATTGIVMRMLENAEGLEGVTHLILDEVHERSIESDFLLIVLRKLVKKLPKLRIILMSATVDAERFSKYLDGAPILTVPGRTFPVETRYLEDVIEALKFTGESRNAANLRLEESGEDDEVTEDRSTSLALDPRKYSASTREALTKITEYRIDYELIAQLLQMIATDSNYVHYSKAVLVFLPGISEIKKLHSILMGKDPFARGWKICLLHSAIATEEQESAFIIPPSGIRKIVIATNIAETGITIPDVTCVIDAGKHKEMRFDEKRQLSRLIESFISRANAKQRRGRAGRVQKGICFHLFTKNRHDNLMPEQQTPEMLRLSLQDLVLRVKICKLGGVEQTLSEALDAPSAKNVRRAIDALIDVKALTSAEDLTPLGKQLARLPLDVFLGKLILLGTIFSCLDVALTIAATLSSKSPFSAALGSRSTADAARMAFKKGDSDILTVYNAYCAWKRVCNANGASEQQFCRTNCLNPQTLSNIEDLKGQLLSSLTDASFVNLTEAEKISLSRARFSSRRMFFEVPPRFDLNTSNDLVVNTVIAWSFYPKLLRKDGNGWRNVANSQPVSLHPTSVNKAGAAKWLSFYHILQSNNRFYNAHETSQVEDFAVVLLCGNADFKLYSGVVVIDGNRIRFALKDWRSILALRILRTQLQHIISQKFRNPGQPISQQQQQWLGCWRLIFSQSQEPDFTGATENAY